MKQSLLGITLISVLSAQNFASADTITIADGDFASVDWLATVSKTTGGATQTVTQANSGGNPGAYRSMTHTLPGPSSIVVIHQYLGMSYDPSTQGAIDFVDYSEDRIQFNAPFSGAAIGARPALLQDGNWFFGPNITFTNSNWQSVNLTGLTSADFVGSGGLTPDFSASGSVISFGYTRSNTNNNSTSLIETNSGIDNWSFVLTTQPVSAVPVPAAVWLFGSGLLGLVGVARRRNV